MKSGFENLNIKIFADGADIASMKEMNDKTINTIIYIVKR